MIRIISSLAILALASSNPLNQNEKLIDPAVDLTVASPEEYRLPKGVISTASTPNYKIDLTLYDNFNESLKFDGLVEITFQVQKPVKDLYFHYIGYLSPKKVNFFKREASTDKPIPVASMEQKKAVDMYVLHFADAYQLQVRTTYKLVIEYEGNLESETMYGFYISTSGDEYLATTQFQPTHARKAYPCFDEPEYKAIFQVTITRPKEYVALTNTPEVDKEDLDNNMQKSTFDKTPTMSTYLVAFVVSKFGYAPIPSMSYAKVYAAKDRLDQSKYAVEVTPKIVTALNKFTNIPYDSKMKKLDQIAIPDFAAGAMENWGLVTYREKALLWSKEGSTTKNKQSLATVIAHELAHSWFGNLVTCKWWKDTWLNEGFARYFEYHITAEAETTWELDKQFVVEQQQAIFSDDAVAHVMPLSSDVYTPAEVSNKFGSITYSKGGSVIRMMSHFLGKEKFKEALQNYLLNSQWTNTEPHNLFTHMQEKIDPKTIPTGKKLEDVMKNWIFEPGYPVVMVSKKDDKLVFQQKKFKATPPELFVDTPQLIVDPKADTIWNVPITFKAEKVDQIQKVWLTEFNVTATAPKLKESAWVLVNIDEMGYYRVNYDKPLWESLRKLLISKQFTQISELNRAQIIDDSMNLARAKELNYATALGITEYLVQETNYYPWYSAFKAFGYLRRRLGEDANLKAFMSKLSVKLFNGTKFEEVNGHVNTLKNVLALEWACELDLPDCVEKSKEMFDEYKKKSVMVPADLRSTVYCSAIRHDKTTENFDFLWNVFKNTKDSTAQLIIMTALGCTKNKAKLNEYLGESIKNTYIRKQDSNTVFNAVLSGNPGGVQECLNFVRTKYRDINHSYGKLNAINGVVSTLAERLTTKAQVEELAKFLNDVKNEIEIVDAETILANARANQYWVENIKPDIDLYLKPAGGSASSVSVATTLLVFSLSLFYFFN